MYKKNDFSHYATRASEITECTETGEIGWIFWFGTKSKASALKKAKAMIVATMDLKLKKFPEIKLPKTQKGQSDE